MNFTDGSPIRSAATMSGTSAVNGRRDVSVLGALFPRSCRFVPASRCDGRVASEAVLERPVGWVRRSNRAASWGSAQQGRNSNMIAGTPGIIIGVVMLFVAVTYSRSQKQRKEDLARHDREREEDRRAQQATVVRAA